MDTNRLYSKFQRMEREGRTSSLCPTIILSTKPDTLAAENSDILRVDPLSSTLDFHLVQKKTTEEDDYKTNDEWQKAELPTRNEYEKEEKLQETENVRENETVHMLQEDLFEENEQPIQHNHDDDDDDNDDDDYDGNSEQNIDSEVNDRNRSAASNHMNPSVLAPDFPRDLSISQTFPPSSSSSAESSTFFPFSLHQLSVMLIAVLLSRSIHKKDVSVSGSDGKSRENGSDLTGMNAMHIVLVNVAIVM